MTKPTTTNTKPDLPSAVLALAQRVRGIKSIEQLEGSFVFDPGVHNAVLTSNLVMQAMVPTAVATLADQVVAVVFRFGLRGWPRCADGQAPPTNPVFEVRATFSVRYDIREGPEISPEVLEHFGRINAQFNLTAYWREFLQSCFARAGMQPPVVPPFNATQAIADLENEAGEKAG